MHDCALTRSCYGRGGSRRAPRVTLLALLEPHFSYCLRHNSDFGRSGRGVPTRPYSLFGSSPKFELWRGRDDAGAPLTLDLTDWETDDAKGHRQMVQSN